MKPADRFYGCVLFDLDGTLLDTVPFILESHQHAWRTCTGSPGDADRILATIGRPLEHAFDDADASLRPRMCETYLEYNQANNDTSVGIFLGVPRMLDALARLGIRTGIVTSKRRGIALRCLRLFDLEGRFDVLVAKEDTDRHKPWPDPLHFAMERLGESDPARVLYVGDSIHDLKSARNAGMPAAIVDWTRMDREELIEASPDLWVMESDDLVRASLPGGLVRRAGCVGGPGPIPAWRRMGVSFGPGSGRDEEVVFAVVRTDDGRVAVVHGRGTPEGAFRVPSGGRSKQEDLIGAVRREVREELGVEAEVLSCAGAMEHRFDDLPFFRSSLFVLSAEGTGGCGGIARGEDLLEVDEVRWVVPEDLPDLARRLRGLDGEWRGWGLFRASTTEALAEFLLGRTGRKRR